MRPKTVLVLFGAFVATTTAAPAPNNNTNLLELCSWQADGGCRTDWDEKCEAQCKDEAYLKGYDCEEVDRHITGSGCWFTFSTCECTCASFYDRCFKPDD